MTKGEVETAIEDTLAQRKKRILNRNALQALFGAFADPVGALGQIFLGRDDAIEAERNRLEQTVILELVCKIDEAISHTIFALKEGGVSPTIIQGLIQVEGYGTRNVTGVEILANAGTVEFTPGTHVRATALGGDTVTGVRIGGSKEGN